MPANCQAKSVLYERKKDGLVSLSRALLTLSLALVFGATSVGSDLKTSTEQQSSNSLEEIGARLFADRRLSAHGDISCATCHVPEKAFTDGRALAIGTDGQIGTRNTPSLWNVALLSSQFWDGRRQSLEAQALDPLLNGKEHGLTNEAELIAIVRGDSAYVQSFKRGLGIDTDAIGTEHIVSAIAAFQRSLRSDMSTFDRFYYHGENDAIPEAAKRGLTLFTGRARCSTCHTVGQSEALFTDQQFHRLGVGVDPTGGRSLGELASTIVSDSRPINDLISSSPDIAALGRFVVTKDPRDIGKFRTPSLRNVALTAPYMHDGSIPSLEGAIDSEVYYRSLEDNRPLILTPAEKKDLAAFLMCLTSPNATAR